MDSIHEYTEWRPSPGSMYPLIASLQEEEMIKPIEDEDPTLKRIELTERGVEELNWWTQHDEHFRARNRSMRKMFWLLHKGMPTDVYTSFSKLMNTVEESLPRLTEENKQTFIETFEDAAGRISEA